MERKIEDVYKKKTHREHILDRPDTYCGSIEHVESPMWISDPKSEELKIFKQELSYVPAFIKLYDEILTNASDHAIRTGKVTKISIQATSKGICIENDGPGIPVVKHQKENLWLPEMIFGHLLTSSNYDDAEERIVGGRNGIGSKITAIFSDTFLIETCDGKKKYKQLLSKNLTEISEPEIANGRKQFTKITYCPDYERFKMQTLDDVHLNIMYKRALDVSVYLGNITISFNGKDLPKFKDIKDYASLYGFKDDEIVTETSEGGWKYAICASEDQNFEQVSIVNGITTYLGGSHVNTLINDIVVKLKEKFTKNKSYKVTNNDIKNRLFLFLSCAVVNPTFSTQSKETLTSKMTKENIDTSTTFINKIAKSEVGLKIKDWLEAKEKSLMASMNRKQTRKTRLVINKLEDASKAGTDKSGDCFLFLTEGDSAKAAVLSGISKIGREYFGIFPLKGKILNVRDRPVSKIITNEELKNIFTILGLTPGKKATKDSLRYGGLIAMTDSDDDGMHIRGLIINLIEYFWPNLLEEGFLYELNLPLLIGQKGKSKKEFYSLNEYYDWKNKEGSAGWSFKYYKGLGSLTGKDMCEYFENIDKYLVQYKKDNEASDLIDISFNKKKANERKEWMARFEYKF